MTGWSFEHILPTLKHHGSDARVTADYIRNQNKIGIEPVFRFPVPIEFVAFLLMEKCRFTICTGESHV